MASVKEIRKRLLGDRGYVNKEPIDVRGSEVWSGKAASIRKKLYEKHETGLDAEKVNTWFTDVKSAVKSMNEYYDDNEGKDWIENYGGDAAAKIAELNKISSDVGFYMRHNKGEFSDYTSSAKEFEEYSAALANIQRYNSDRAKYYSRWGSEEEFSNGRQAVTSVKNWFSEVGSAVQSMAAYYNDYEGKWVDDIYSFDGAARIKVLAENSGAIAELIENNKSSFSDYESVKKAFDEYSSTLERINTNNSELSNYYSQWGSEEDYNTWNKYYGVLDEDDFDYYSKLGASVANPAWNETYAPIEIFGWKPLGDGEDIGNMVTFAEANKAEALAAAANNMRDGGGGNGPYINKFNLINSFMKDNEKRIYNYFIGKGDKQSADEYLTYITETLTLRQAGYIAAQTDGHLIREPVLSVIAGLDNFVSGVKNLDNFIMGTEPDENISAINYAYQITSGNNEGAWKVVNDLAQTIGNMAPSIVVGSLTSGLGGALTMGTSAMGNAYADMKSLGYDDGAAQNYAFLVGASETTLSYLISGISKLGGGSKGIFQTIAGKVVPHLDNAIARVAIQVGGNMADEGLEEAIQEVLDPIFKMAVTGEDFEGIDLENAIYSGLLGALSGGVLEGIPTVKKNVIQSAKAKNIYGQNGGTDLVYESLHIDPENAYAQKMKHRLDDGKNISGYQLNRLAETNEQNLRTQDKGKMRSAAESKLTKLGETGDVGKIADVITKIRAGEKITKAEQSILVNSKYGRRVSTTMNPDIIEQGGYDTVWAEKIGTERINEKAYNKTFNDSDTANIPLNKKPIAVDEPSEENKDTIIRNDIDVSEKVSGTGNTVVVSTGEVVSINKKDPIAKVENVDGERVVYLNTDGGRVKAGDVKYSSESEALLIESFLDVSPSFANAVISNYDGSMPVDTYIKGMREGILLYGAHNFKSVGTDISKDTFFAELSAENQAFALKLGRALAADDAKIADKNLHKAIENSAEKAKASGEVSLLKGESKSAKKGRVSFEKGVKIEKGQRKTVALAKHLARAMGIDIVFYDARTTESSDGKGANGYYDKDTDTIYLDVQGMESDAKTIAFTLSHELVHFIKKWSPKKFDAFAKFLMEQYADHDVNAALLLKNKMAELNTTDVDLAYEEMIADACETMLLDSDAAVKLMELRKSDLDLFEKIKLHIGKILNSIRNFYKNMGYEPSSDEAKALISMKDMLERFYSLFEDAAVDATQNYQAMQGAERISDAEVKKQVKKARGENFKEDKYYARQIDNWNSLKSGGYITVGEISEGSPINIVGVPDGTLYFDNDKILSAMTKHDDHLSADDLKNIPKLLDHPIVIAEYRPHQGTNTVNVYGNLTTANGIPIVVGIVITKGVNKNIITKVRTIHARRDFKHQITDESVLYLGEDKKETKAWFRLLDNDVPLEGTKFGFIRSISQKELSVKHQKKKTSNREILADALESVAQSDIERKKLQEWREKAAAIEAEQERLAGIRAEIGEIQYKKSLTMGEERLSVKEFEARAMDAAEEMGISARDVKFRTDRPNSKYIAYAGETEVMSADKHFRTKAETDRLSELRDEATKISNRIGIYDRQLLNLESTSILKSVLEREKAKAYKKAEQKGREALEAAREKAVKEQREIVYRYQESRKKSVEGRRKTELRHKIQRVVGELNRYLLKSTKDKHVPENLREAVAAALDAVNMDTVDAENRIAQKREAMMTAKSPQEIEKLAKEIEHISEMGGSMAEKISKLKEAYDEILNSDDPEIAGAYREEISTSIGKVIKEVGNTPLRNMTHEQLELVYNMYKMVLKTVREANKAFKTKKGETISELVGSTDREVRSIAKLPFQRNVVSLAVQRTGWHLLKPYVAFRTIGSDTLTDLYKEIRRGEDRFYESVSEATEFMRELKEKYGYKSWDQKELKSFTAKNGATFELTLEQIMTLYAYSRRKQAIEHITVGGFVLENSLITKKSKLGVPIKYEVTTKDAFNISEETWSEIVSTLSDEQKAFVDEMQSYLSDVLGAKGNEISLALYDVALFNEKYYLPIKSSNYYRAFDPKVAGEIKLRNASFSKETTPHANNPIVLHNFTDLWAEHANDMSMYHSFVLALEDFTRVYNYNSSQIKGLLESAYPGSTDYINKFLRDLNGGVRSETVGWAEKLTSLAKKGAVLGSASVAIQQPSAIMRAMAYVNPAHFVLTTHKSVNLSKHKKDWAELKKYAPVAGIKEMGRFDVGMGQATVKQIKGDKKISDRIDDIFSAAPAFMDEVTWVAIWNAVKRETAQKHKDLQVGSDAFLKVAGERFTDVISLSQVYDSVFSRSDIMRNNNYLAKSLTAFMAEPTTTLNMLWDACVQAKRSGSFKGVLKATAPVVPAVAASIVFNSLLKSIVLALRDDDEDESYIEKYLEHFSGNLRDNIILLNYLPIAKDIVAIFHGYSADRMDMTLISDLKRAVEAFYSEEKTVYEKWSGLVVSVSAFFGVPAKNVERDIRAVVNTFFGDREDTTKAGILYAISKGWSGEEKSDRQQLYEAIIAGDTEQTARVQGRFDNQSEVNSAIRKALRENDYRIKEAAMADLEGDVVEYDRIVSEMLDEGLFSEDNIKGAINAEIDELDGDEPPSTPRHQSIYEAAHYYQAVVAGEDALAEKIRQDIIDTAVENGKSEADAEKNFESSFRSYVKKFYTGGKIERSMASKMLTQYTADDSDDVYWDLKEWDFEIKNGADAAYSKYNDFYSAVKTGKNLRSVIKEYTDHGVKTETLASQITSYYKPLYIKMSNSERAGIKGYLLNAYAVLGYDRDKKSRDIDRWLEN